MRATLATGSAPARVFERGFTLIEMLVVMAVVILVSSALPLALDRTLPSRRVAVTAQKVVTAMRDAGSQSVATGRAVILELRSGALVSEAGVSVSFPATTRVLLTDLDGRPLNRVRLYPDGSSDSARFEVRERAHVRVVAVRGETGRVMEEPLRAR
jgi:general secretion pathway protein H